MNYYDQYITLGHEKHSYGKSGTWTIWPCFLEGESVGYIEHYTDHRKWEKPYEAKVNEEGRTYGYGIGYYNTLVEAKRALKDKARVYLDALKMQERNAPAAFLPSGDFQFYPTPSVVAGRLFAGIAWEKVYSVLEPSAGRGDLVDYMKDLHHRCYDRRGHWGPGRREFDIDCVEIDENLRALLKGKGYRVVHDDFLTFTTRKHYDLIVMNPPFEDGDLHLLRALEMLNPGGQIACILNAETIRNPYTVSRKALLKELKRRGASIKFCEDAFKKADRRAEVDIAIIHVRAYGQEQDTSLWDDLKKAADVEWEAQRDTTDLAPASSVERLIREYDLLCAAGIDLMKKYNGVARHLFNGTGDYSHPIIQLSIGDHSPLAFAGFEDINDFLTRARSRYWQELFDLPELRDKMTSQMRKDYSETIREMRNYEFSEFNIRQVIKKIMGQLQMGVEEAIEKCFDKLSAEHAYHDEIENENIHLYSGWKTNKAHYVNNRCIIPVWGCYARKYKTDKYGRYRDVLDGLSTSGCFAVLDDLEKALDYLDKGETTATNLWQMLEYAVTAGKTKGIKCKYFEVDFFKKGTCHIKFYDQKIVDRLNIYIGRKRTWLPPSYGKKPYHEMTPEEREVVDSFQGQEKYNTIMENTENYLIEPASHETLRLM